MLSKSKSNSSSSSSSSLFRLCQRLFSTTGFLWFVVLLLLLLQPNHVQATSMKLVVWTKSSSPFCNGAFSLDHVQVACGGTNGECSFGTQLRVYGSILANKKVTSSATLGVNVYIDGLVSRDLGYTDDIDLCSYFTSSYDDESCPSAGMYDFDFTYTIPTLDDSAGWWFGYKNKIGVNVDITDSETDGTQFSSTCHMVLVVTNLYDDYNNNGSSMQSQRILYWSLLGFVVTTGGFWIGYSVRRRCRVVCLEDLNRCVGGGGYDDDDDDEEDGVAATTTTATTTTLRTTNPKKKKKNCTNNPDDPEDDIKIVHSAAFEIMKDHPVGRKGSIPRTKSKYLQPPPSRRQPLMDQDDEEEEMQRYHVHAGMSA